MMPNGCHLIAIRAGPLRWLVRQDSNPAQALLRDPDQFLTDPRLLIKSSDIVTIGRVAAGPGYPGLILRRLNYGVWQHRLRDFFRPSRAKLAMLRGLALEAAGVPTPRAVAVAERRRFRWPIKAYLLTEEATEAASIEWFIHKRRGVPRLALRNIAAAFAKLHNAGFSHRDLKPSNILINDRHEVALIDLDAVRVYRRISEHRALLDLARFIRGLVGIPRISPSSLARFVYYYCKARHITDWKYLCRELNGRL